MGGDLDADARAVHGFSLDELDAQLAALTADLTELNREAEARLADAAPELARERRQKHVELSNVNAARAEIARRVLRDCRAIGDRLLKDVPAPDYLLRLPSGDEDQRGFLERGVVGFVIARPGAGKTTAIIQLGIAVAKGLRWLDRFETPAAGRVLLLLAEDDQARVDRRLQRMAAMMGILPEKASELRLVGTPANHARYAAYADDLARNLFAEPLAGVDVALQSADRDTPNETAFADELRAFLSDNAGSDGWRLIVLDTLARCGGPLVEKDNFPATAFVRTLETLRSAPGNPTVLVLHHPHKGELDSQSNLESARGASALVGAVKWMINLDPKSDERVLLRLTKTNDGPPLRPMMLAREQFGFLRWLPDEAVPDGPQRDRTMSAPYPTTKRPRPLRGGSSGADRAAGDAPINRDRLGKREWKT